MSTAPVANLREKRNKWLDWLNGDDRHSIANQLNQLAWDMASFEMVVELYRLAPDAPEGGKKLNGLIFGLLERCFLQSLLLGFRRLMDDPGPDGPRGVYSLKRLLEYLSANASLLTRESLLAIEVEDRNNYPHDYSDQMWNIV